MKLDDAIQRYLRHLEANGCSRHTIRSYRFDLGALCGFLGEGDGDVACISALDSLLTSPCALRRPDGGRRSCLLTMNG